MSDTRKATKSTTATGDKFDGFTDQERAAMKEHAQDLKQAARRSPKAAKTDGKSDVQAKIAEMTGSDRALAERVHDIVTVHAPELTPKLWYGMPAYARDGKIICFFQSAAKFKARYATLGFNDGAHLDDGAMWPTAFALTKLTDADEARIGALLKQAAG